MAGMERRQLDQQPDRAAGDLTGGGRSGGVTAGDGTGADRAGRDRFPGFDVLKQTPHWDPVTSAVVWSRTGPPPPIRYFTPEEEAVATALCNQLLDLQADPPGSRVPVVNMIDSRLAEQQTDGWHYQDMPEDGTAWRTTLAALDADARERFGDGFATCRPEHQAALIRTVRERGSDPWHGLPAKHVWSLWTRYACTAFYAHPTAWNELGFPGPAYPRGYKNPGIDAREPFEVRDARPADQPLLTETSDDEARIAHTVESGSGGGHGGDAR
jgi:hypothetical protein